MCGILNLLVALSCTILDDFLSPRPISSLKSNNLLTEPFSFHEQNWGFILVNLLESQMFVIQK